MKKNSLFLIIILVFILVFFSVGVMGYELTSRSLAMGGAFTAQGDNLEIVLYNPALIEDSSFIGLSLNMGLEMNNYSEYSDLLSIEDNFNNNDVINILREVPDDVSVNSQMFFGAKLDSFALSYNNKLSTSAVNINSDSANIDINKFGVGALSFAGRITDPPLDIGALSYGVNIKLIDVDRINYSVINENTYTKTKEVGSGYGLDIGLLARLTDYLKVGYFMENVLASDIKLSGQEEGYQYNFSENQWDNISEESTSSVFTPSLKSRLGASLEVPVLNLTLAADIDNVFNQGKEGQILHMGLEKNLLFNGFSLRVGKITGDKIDYNTLGLGLNLTGFSLDSALAFEGDSGDNLATTISFNALF
ncbi:MAG: hypothetical protein ACOCRU_00780 [bacterium]